MYYCDGVDGKPCEVGASSFQPFEEECDYCWAVKNNEPKEEIERLREQNK